MRDLRSLIAAARVVDLSHRLTPGFPLYPVYDPVKVADKFTTERDGFYVRSWSFDEHCGTHVDAPAHFGEGAATVDLIAPEDLVLGVAVIDIRERVARDHDAMVVPDDIRAWEGRHGELPDRSALFALTGWGERIGDPAAYLNADAAGVMHAPGFSPEVTELLKEEHPGVRAIGLDTASLDIGASTDYEAHVSWLPSGRYGIENLARLDSVPPTGAVAVIGAPTFAGGSGGPSRVLVFVP